MSICEQREFAKVCLWLNKKEEASRARLQPGTTWRSVMPPQVRFGYLSLPIPFTVVVFAAMAFAAVVATASARFFG